MDIGELLGRHLRGTHRPMHRRPEPTPVRGAAELHRVRAGTSVYDDDEVTIVQFGGEARVIRHDG